MVISAPANSLARALEATRTIIGGIKEDQWSSQTPCPDWTVRALLNHLVVGNRIFAAILRGDPPTSDERRRRYDHDMLGPDALQSYREAGAELVAAFSQPTVLHSVFEAPVGTVPGVVLFHLRLTEILVHGWDLARATRQPAAMPDDLALEALAFSSSPRAPAVPRTGHPFGPIHDIAGSAPAIDRLAAYLGRAVPPEATR